MHIAPRSHSLTHLNSDALRPHAAASEKKLPSNMTTKDPRSPDRFNSSVKVRNYETVCTARALPIYSA